ncbi:hypothetical protein [Flavobacterium granuli]|uniref:DUF2306 domain-containing protein n=1 Tax=Flavobacterium granuli TaxID=280093 RepID=A0ABU1S7B2_9FLAO|nr:hypothetical protein [Flavobacterium granuli]MDR6846109.1 hypothetical protein [Flavobacterium granuli]
MKIIKRQKPSFFFCMALVSLFVTLIGFAKTFIIPVTNGEFKAPLIIHIHGAFAFAWIILFLTQTSLIYFKNYKTHQLLGFIGFFISAGVMITMIPTGLHVVKRDLSQGIGEGSYSSLLGVITSGILFFSLVLIGILNRKHSETHKRFMLLSIIVVLWPAWFRFRHYFPSVPRPDIWFALILADSLIVVAWIWDKLKNGNIHPVLKYGGLFIIIEQSFEVWFFDCPIWRSIAKWLYGIL